MSSVEGGPKRPFHVPRGLEPYHEARALRELFARLRASDLAPGTYDGSLAVQVCDRFVSQELSSMLVDNVARYDRTSLLALAANEAGAVLGERRRTTLSLKASLNAPWGDDRRVAAAFGEDAAVFLTKASQLVLEAALSEPRGGTVAPDRVDWAHLLAIADAMLQVAQRRALARFDIQPINVKVDGEGHVSITQTEALTLDIANFEACRRLMALRPGAEAALTTNLNSTMGFADVARAVGSPGSWGEAPFESFVNNEEVPSGFREIDRAMREQLGAGYDPLLAVLKTAGSWPTSLGLEYTTVGPDELARSAADWSRLPLDQTSAAVRLLTLRPEDLRAEGIRYWLTEKRRYRATTRPLIEAVAGTIWIVPELATGTLSVLTRYMFDGRLPWPDLPGPCAAFSSGSARLKIGRWSSSWRGGSGTTATSCVGALLRGRRASAVSLWGRRWERSTCW